MATSNDEKLSIELLESIFRTSKKTVQEYVREIERHCRFKSSYRHLNNGTVLDDRSKLIDLYEASVQQDAHLASVLQTLESQIIGERYMLARQNDKGRYIKDVEATKKIQGTQFIKIIRGIVESKLYGYTGLEILPDIDERTGKLKSVNNIERRNILPDQRRMCKDRVSGVQGGILMTLNIVTIIFLSVMAHWGYSLQQLQVFLQRNLRLRIM